MDLMNLPRHPPIHVVGAAIFAGGRCLVTQRSRSMSAPLCWEFPGGKVEPGERPRTALVREIREELALEIRVGDVLGYGESDQAGRRIRLTVYRATIVRGTLELREHRARRWIRASDIAELRWAAADRPILEPLHALLR